MPQMTQRDRVLAAMNHRTPDRTPLDIGGIKTTSLNVHAYENLREYLTQPPFTLESPPAEIAHWRSQRTHMHESVSRCLGSDVRRVHIPLQPPLPAAITAPVQCDEWGNEWTQAPTGLYFVSRSALEHARSIDDVRRHAWPDPACLMNVDALAEAARRLRASTDCAICLDLPDGVAHQTQFLLGFERWLTLTVDDRRLFEEVAERVADTYSDMVAPVLDAVGDKVDLILHCDDIATQRGPLISPRAWRQAIKPRQARIFSAIKAHTSAKLLFHSCGSVAWALPDLIEMGVDGINPVQVSAKDMNTARLKQEFGRDLFFWGAIDTHHVLPFGTPSDVRDEVRRRIDDLTLDGGYIVGSVHIIQAEVPPENVVAMAEAAREVAS
jgi:uroporphyrinogen decarboxylase